MRSILCVRGRILGIAINFSHAHASIECHIQCPHYSKSCLDLKGGGGGGRRLQLLNHLRGGLNIGQKHTKPLLWWYNRYLRDVYVVKKEFLKCWGRLYRYMMLGGAVGKAVVHVWASHVIGDVG